MPGRSLPVRRARTSPTVRSRVVGDAQQHPGVVGQETPACHDDSLSSFRKKIASYWLASVAWRQVSRLISRCPWCRSLAGAGTREGGEGAAGKGSSGRQLNAARAVTNEPLTGSAAPTTSAFSLVLELLAAETRERARPAPAGRRHRPAIAERPVRRRSPCRCTRLGR